MWHLYLLSSVLILSITYSWYSLYGSFWGIQQQKHARVRAVPAYMWDIYNNGVNSSEADVVKGIYPKILGSTFNFRNHRGRELKFVIPEPQQDELMVKAEVRVTISEAKNRETYFQVYLKGDKWIFLEEKKVSDVSSSWISLQVTHSILQPGIVTFFILMVFSGNVTPGKYSFLHPVLLLSYSSTHNSIRRKRSPEPDDYEEKTNRIWQDHVFSSRRQKSGCRRKPLYIKFSDIDYDSWIVAPSGYEAFQCVGKCTFPVGEHLSPTKHAILQTLIHDTYPWKTSRACCVPTKLDPISILYVDENGVLTYRFRYSDMVVAECGCR